MTRLLLLACLLASFPGHATDTTPPDIINLCIDDDGRKILSNQACPTGYRTHAQQVRPNVLSSEGLRAWASRSPPLPEKSRAQLEQERKEALWHAERQERSLRCENARRDYSFESTWKSRKARPQAKKAIMDRECAGL